jgi:hypothetical protein
MLRREQILSALARRFGNGFILIGAVGSLTGWGLEWHRKRLAVGVHIAFETLFTILLFYHTNLSQPCLGRADPIIYE